MELSNKKLREIELQKEEEKKETYKEFKMDFKCLKLRNKKYHAAYV